MAAHQPPPRQQQLSRLFIPPNINAQQPMNFSDNPPLFSPALPTSIQQGMHPPFPIQHPNMNSLQTPMQPGFFPPPPNAPGRPMHRVHPSMAQLAGLGILPPPGMLQHNGLPPMTPLGQNGFPTPILPGAPFQPFVPRSKRTQSVSTGGPPKAVLGGPQRKVSPLPPAATAAVTGAAAVPGVLAVPKKKIIVNLPKETIREESEVQDGEVKVTRRDWARDPIPMKDMSEQSTVPPPDIMTADPFPSDAWRYYLPPTVDVFLPGKDAWDTMKRKIIEEKLEKLGVERVGGSVLPHLHAPHARATSISSPADPALLFFKLNKLQQSQNASASGSLSTSPQPPLQLSPSPGASGNGAVPPRFQGRHGHSMSLAQPPSFQSSSSPVYNPAAAFNPFGPAAVLGSDQIFNRASPESRLGTIHAPQGRVPTNISSLAPPQSSSRPESRPDFTRGFGLDTTEEEEEPPEDEHLATHEEDDDTTDKALNDTLTIEDVDASREDNDDTEDEGEGVSTVAQSRIHSRHVSRLSAALSLVSVGRVSDPALIEEHEIVPTRTPLGPIEVDETDKDAVGEWTGSEDLRTTEEISEDESIGEWSNPSDEERARQERMHRRMLKRSKQVQQDLEQPRRLPNFPRPPETGPLYLSVDDDIISNPSEEERLRGVQESYLEMEEQEHYSPAAYNSQNGRPLPPVPHSRSGSAQYSYHDPALAHSRQTSEHHAPGGLHPPPVPSAAFTAPPSRKDSVSLNPLAKPFVFGTSSFGQSSSSSPSTATFSHTRVPSLGKPLNAAAAEFKPSSFTSSGFTFQPPPGVPQLSFVPVPRPLPTPPIVVEPVRATQGREKRQRRGSSASFEDVDASVASTEEDKDNMTSFKFPPSADSTRLIRHSAPASPPASGGLELPKEGGLNATAKPFTFSGFPQFGDEENIAPHYPASEGDAPGGKRKDDFGDSTLKGGFVEPESAEELPFPPTSTRTKRAPIPLDFKHPVSTTTVPAAVFKNLNNGDSEERTRRTVRSRLSSRDIFEHSPRPSLDDLNVPPISQRITRNRLFTDPGFRDVSPEHDDIFSSSRRRSSLPPRHHTADSSGSDLSIGPVNLSRRMEMQQYEQRLETLLDEKIEMIKRMIEEQRFAAGEMSMSSSTEAMINEVVSLFRTQLQESATRGLEESQIDARGELDFELLKGIIEQSHADARAQLHQDLSELMAARGGSGPNAVDALHFKTFAEEISKRTIDAVLSATSQINQHVHALERSRPSAATEREAIVREVTNALAPHLAALRTEPIDYEGLTIQLTQAVKPHISQLIDLASDKRETAGLIVDSLVPILPKLTMPQATFDIDGVVGRLTSEVRKVIEPLDAHEIKEQVSDLVVERLDSRLAVRDRAFNVEVVTEKVTESVGGLLKPLHELRKAVDDLSKSQKNHPEFDITILRDGVIALLADLPERLSTAASALVDAKSEFRSEQARMEDSGSTSKLISRIDSTLSSVSEHQSKLVSTHQELSNFCQEIVKHIDNLPETMVEATKVLENVHSDIMTRDTSKKDADEIRKLMTSNAELQVQLAKARGAHGQVRVEKDNLSDRLHKCEAERDQIRSKFDELQTVITTKVAEAAAFEARNAELEEALSQALDRIKSSDIATQASQARITTLEKTVLEINNEKHSLKSKVDTLESTTAYFTREKESLEEQVSFFRQQNDELLSQQSQWDELRRVNENIQSLAQLVSQADNDELKDLRRSRDRFKVLEGEHAALQRRLKDQENKAANQERTAQTARQNLAQAQQRAAEWERRAKDSEHELQSTRHKLDEVEQSHSQLDADYSLVKLQLEERDAEERLQKDRESKLRDQIAALEEQVARLQAETDQANKALATAQASTSASSKAVSKPVTHAPRPTQPASRFRQNGFTTPSAHNPTRPDSRASTIYGDSRVATPTAPAGHTNGTTPSIREATPPQPSVWDSIHAPTGRRDNAIKLPMTPKTNKRPGSYYRPQIPSPTPSNVSAAPTLQGDGWWM
ncbi:hypothetical protein C8Q75DRAFT_732200 [Abortiporus biennis]|nr:hypothetical protein C8Q75DRAFT_732200 [Abortiporus biennis]